jgi:flavin-dependent dehydrogenase
LERCDVAILGAGPAGTAAAITLATAGADVVLCEGAAFPRFRPGETLHPGIQPIFERLGVGELVAKSPFSRFAGIQIEKGRKRERAPFGGEKSAPWLGFHAPRESLDQILLAGALRCGARLRQPCRAREIISERGAIRGVITDGGAIRAQWVIDAAGSSHWLARRLRVPVQRIGPRRFARYGYVRGRFVPSKWPRFILGQSGWSWRAAIARDQLAWVDLHEGGLPPNLGAPGDLAAFAPGRIVSRTADVSWRICGAVAGAGWALAGDAAAVLDPSSGHGVLRALMSGMMIAHLLVNAPGQVASRSYEKWFFEWFNHDLNRLAGILGQGSSPTSPPSATSAMEGRRPASAGSDPASSKDVML